MIPEEEKVAYWKAMEDNRQKWEDLFADEIIKRFNIESAEVAKAFSEGGLREAIKEVDRQIPKWRSLFEAMYTAIIEFFGDDEVSRLRTGNTKELKQFDFDPTRPAVQDWVKQNAAKKVTFMSDTTKDKIAAVIGRGLADDQPSDTIARAIRDLYSQWIAPDSPVDLARAYMIARTESTGAMNFGHRSGASQFQEATQRKVKKVWISSRDSRVREAHSVLDGETRDLDEPYSNGMMYPGDPSGSASQVINCRCVEQHVITNELMEEEIDSGTFREFSDENDIARWAESQFKDAYDSLTSEEKSAINLYKGASYSDINGLLRGTEQIPESNRSFIENAINNLSKAITKFVVGEDVIAYRGIRNAASILGAPGKAIGTVITDQGFMSTALFKEITRGFAYGEDAAVLQIRIPKGTNAAYSFAQASETELILNKGTKLKVIDETTDENGARLLITEVVQ